MNEAMNPYSSVDEEHPATSTDYAASVDTVFPVKRFLHNCADKACVF